MSFPLRAMLIRARLVAFALAPALAAAGLGLAYVTVRPFGGAFLYFPLTAVVASSLSGGTGPGLLTLALSLVGFDYLFLAHQGTLGLGSVRDVHRFMEFALAGSVAAWLCGRYRAARIAADEAAREAKRIGELQERLVAVVGHDLSNPLTAVRAGFDIMRRLAPLDPQQDALIGRMQRSTRRMERLVADVLGFAHSRQGRSFPVRLVRASLGKACDAVISEYRYAFPDRVIRLSITGDDEAPLDPARLEQVVSNLLSNAVKHGSPTEAIDVTIIGLPRELVLVVTNRGPPIPRELLPTIFEPYRSGTKTGEGLGLGLFVVKEIVDAHEGSVHVRSDQGVTTFKVHLPRRPAVLAALSEARTSNVSEPPPPSPAAQRAHNA